MFLMYDFYTQLQVDSSAPNSGSATTEVLSPVQEPETTITDLSKPKNLTALNNELSKINLRRDSTMHNAHEERPADSTESDKNENVKSPTHEPKMRRVSRFKVSVVTEPDPSKLVIPEKEEEVVVGAKVEENASENGSVNTTPIKRISIKEVDASEKFNVAKDIINNTMQKLHDNLSQVSFNQGKFFCGYRYRFGKFDANWVGRKVVSF